MSSSMKDFLVCVCGQITSSGLELLILLPWDNLKKSFTEQERFIHSVILNLQLKSLLLTQELSKVLLVFTLSGAASVLGDAFKYCAKK